MPYSQNNTLRFICEEPYRLFFPLGILLGVFGVSHWFFYTTRLIESYSGFYHSSVQMMAYMTSFVTGFLLTAMPRFSGARHTGTRELLSFLTAIVGIFIFLSFGFWIGAESVFIIWLFLLARFAFVRFAGKKKENAGEKKIEPPKEFLWIPIAIFHGICGASLLILSQLKIIPTWFAQVAKPMMEQGFIFSIVVGVGGFLIPRIAGTFKPSESEKTCETQKPAAVIQQGSPQWHLLLGLIFFISFWLEGFGLIKLAYALRALVITTQFIGNGILPAPPKVPYLFVRLLWISVWMIVIGFWMVVFFPDFRVAMLHIVFIGGLSLMVFAVATMVILSHAGKGDELRRPLWIFWVVGFGVLTAVLKRVAVVFFPDDYFHLVATAAFLWVIAGLSWLCFIMLRVFKTPGSGDFERIHEEAKKQVKQFSS